MRKNYLVTGGSGFLGSHIADFLSNKKNNVTLFDKKKSIYKNKQQKMIIGSINKFTDIQKATKNIHTVFHFAASADLNYSNKKPFETIESNIIGTVNLLKSCLKNKVKKIVFASSIYARSEQGGIYSTSKLSSEMIIEQICKKFNLKFVILRFGTVYGERANSFNTVQNFIDKAKKKKNIYRETRGNEIRSYIHVDDVAKITFKSIKKKYENNYYNIFGDKNVIVKNLLNMIKKYVPNLKIRYAKKDKKKYNYKKNPFTYKLRVGKILKLNNYISIEAGLKKLIL
jgi:UDP-glucose 4-epimerase